MSVNDLVNKALDLANRGHWDEADRVWHQVRALDPRHPEALCALGVSALRRGDQKSATALLDAASQVAGSNLSVLQTLISARSALGDPGAEATAIQQALAVNAYFLPALIAKASYLERHDKPFAAVTAWNDVLKVAPPESHWPDALRKPLTHALEVTRYHARVFGQYLSEQLEPLQSRLTGATAERWREAIAIMAGQSKPYQVDCNQLHVPRLPAIPFYERSLFPWAAAVEARTDDIRSELKQALSTCAADFEPYINYRPGDPVNQWQELNHSPRWSTYVLWRGGVPVEDHLRQCPATRAALEQVAMAEISGLCPNVMFSALAPHTHIPPHHGETNARLVVHLPLIVPDHCSFRVGFEQRRWQTGELLFFDDTLEHEARNDSDALRVVLIFDVWNPLLEPAERELVQQMTAATRAFAARGRV